MPQPVSWSGGGGGGHVGLGIGVRLGERRGRNDLRGDPDNGRGNERKDAALCEAHDKRPYNPALGPASTCAFVFIQRVSATCGAVRAQLSRASLPAAAPGGS